MCREPQKRKPGPSLRELQVVGQMGTKPVLWDAAYQAQPAVPAHPLTLPHAEVGGAMEEGVHPGGWEAERAGRTPV